MLSLLLLSKLFGGETSLVGVKLISAGAGWLEAGVETFGVVFITGS